MKGLVTTILILFSPAVLPVTAISQGVVYVSNLNEQLFGYMVGNGSQSFVTGISSNGYYLNNVTLLMGTWLGNASNFNVSVYSSLNNQAAVLLGALAGTSDPETTGEYTYTASGLLLNPNTEYWIVAACDSWSTSPLMPPGGYAWQMTSSANYTATDGWSINNIIGPFPEVQQFAINATPVPEPNVLIIFFLGASCIVAVSRFRICRLLD